MSNELYCCGQFEHVSVQSCTSSRCLAHQIDRKEVLVPFVIALQAVTRFLVSGKDLIGVGLLLIIGAVAALGHFGHNVLEDAHGATAFPFPLVTDEGFVTFIHLTLVRRLSFAQAVPRVVASQRAQEFKHAMALFQSRQRRRRSQCAVPLTPHR